MAYKGARDFDRVLADGSNGVIKAMLGGEELRHFGDNGNEDRAFWQPFLTALGLSIHDEEEANSLDRRVCCVGAHQLPQVYTFSLNKSGET
jgi:hypothetical protein